MAYFKKEPGYGYMLVLGLMYAGFNAVDRTTDMMVPQTCLKFTNSFILINFLIALNRLCGFTVGPYVAWKSDRLVTRFGRRRPFFLIGLPMTLFSMLLLGSMPLWLKGAAQTGVLAIALLCLFNFCMQFFQDLNCGGVDPLYADTFSHEKLGRAMSIRNYATLLVGLFMTYVAMQLAAINQFLFYCCTAACLLISFFLLLFFVREREPKDLPPPQKYNPLEHIGMMWKSPDYIKVALMGACYLSILAVFALNLALLATRTIGLSQQQFGKIMSVDIIIGFALALPLGYLIDRLGPKFLVAIGFVFFAISSALIAWFVHSYTMMYVAIAFRSLAMILTGLPMVSILFQYVAPRERGAIYGSISFLRSSSAFVISALMGFLVQYAVPDTPVKFVPADFRVPAQVYNKITETNALAKIIHSISLMDKKQFMASKPEEQKLILTSCLNAAIASPGNELIVAAKDQILPRRARVLIQKTNRTNAENIILKRAIIETYLGNAIIVNANYRLPYILCLAMSVAACLITLTMRKGKYARLIGDSAPTEFDIEEAESKATVTA